MKPLHVITLLGLSAVVINMAFVWCFEDTTMGGYLPFLIVSLAPLAGFGLGWRARHHANKRSHEVGEFRNFA